MRKQIINLAKKCDADVVGFAPSERFDKNDPVFKIFPGVKTVIGLGFRVLRGSMRGVEEGTTYYQYTTMGVENLEDNGGDVDVILTHEPPSLIKSSMLMRMGLGDRVNKLNGYLEEINRTFKFKKWYFGYMHEDKVITPGHIAVFKDLWPIVPEEL